MQHKRVSALLAAVLAGATMVIATGALAGIANTRHNLSSTNTLGADGNNVTDTADVCVFCHTPHGADISQTDNPPLWNKRLLTGATYQTYAQMNSASIDGQILAVGSISLACLSCHDGTQAMDNIINAPGSGGLLADGGATNGRNFAWTGSPRATTEGLLTGIANLGIDLRNDHPIGIEYCGGGFSGAGTGPCNDEDFRTPTRGAGTLANVFWVDTPAVGVAGTRDKTDMALFTRTFTGGLGPSVECASCHDPHLEQGVSNGGLAGATFLRVSNAGSAVCLACHTK